jgi:hypothetical protein
MQGRLGEPQSLSKQFRDAEILLALTVNEAEFLGLPVNRTVTISTERYRLQGLIKVMKFHLTQFYSDSCHNFQVPPVIV